MWMFFGLSALRSICQLQLDFFPSVWRKFVTAAVAVLSRWEQVVHMLKR